MALHRTLISVWRYRSVPGVTFVTDKHPLFCYNTHERWLSMATTWVVPTIDRERCDACGLCVEQCPTSAVEMGPHGPVIARPEDCTYCTDCEAVCPRDAIRCPYEVVWGFTTDAR